MGIDFEILKHFLQNEREREREREREDSRQQSQDIRKNVSHDEPTTWI